MEKINVFFSTGNQGKLKELKEIFTDVFGPGHNLQGQAPECEETGTTFLANAKIKAEALYEEFQRSGRLKENFWILSDDSGLCVDALGGRPGIRSARYAGDHVEDGAHMKKLLGELQKSGAKHPWRCHYHCALYLVRFQHGHRLDQWGEGRCFGEIVEEPRGGSGFGYDPIFLLPDLGLRFSELEATIKNDRSHRKAAYVDLKRKFGENL